MNQLNFITSFLQQVQLNGEQIAIKEEGNVITYSSLYAKALAVYEYLNQTANTSPLIGVDCNAGIDSYAYIIGVWLYGSAYVPINFDLPEELTNQLIIKAELTTVLRKENSAAVFSVQNSNHQIQPFVDQELAYVLFTSGTTGEPKGVCISKNNLNAFTNHYLEGDRYDFKKQDKFLQSYELNFDVSVFCFSIPLMIGASLVLPNKNGIRYLSIASSIIKEEITVCSNVPSTAMHLFPKLNSITFPSLRYCFFSGEALYGNWALAWMKSAFNAQVYNCYGPTETTIVCTAEHLNGLDKEYFASAAPLPLGAPFENMALKMVDEEIFFSGRQVFPNYLNGEQGKRLLIDSKSFYGTGDFAEMDENGKLIFKGRRDEQVQINGYRVELKAIDNCIYKWFNLLSISMVFRDKSGGQKIITTLESQQLPGEMIQKIQDKLIEELPSYYVPKTIFFVKYFPRNQNQKLDKPNLKEMIEGKIRE